LLIEIEMQSVTDKITYALYARAIKGEQKGEMVMCWNFQDVATAEWVGQMRTRDVSGGHIEMWKHYYDTETKELVKKEKIKDFHF